MGDCHDARRVVVGIETADLAIVAALVLPLQDGIAVASHWVLMPRTAPSLCYTAKLHVALAFLDRLAIQQHVGKYIGSRKHVKVDGSAEGECRFAIHCRIPCNDIRIGAGRSGGILAACHYAACNGRIDGSCRIAVLHRQVRTNSAHQATGVVGTRAVAAYACCTVAVADDDGRVAQSAADSSDIAFARHTSCHIAVLDNHREHIPLRILEGAVT